MVKIVPGQLPAGFTRLPRSGDDTSSALGQRPAVREVPGVVDAQGLLDLAPEPSAQTGQLLDRQRKQPPATDYDGSKGGVLGLMQQAAADGGVSALDARPLSVEELRHKLDALRALTATSAQGSAALGAGTSVAEAQQDLRRVGASLRQQALADPQAISPIMEELLGLLIELLFGLGMSAGDIDALLARSLGRAGGWTGPSGGYASQSPAGRPRGGRWSSGAGSAPSTYKPERWTPVKDPAPAGFGVDGARLQQIVPGLGRDKAEAVAGHLNKAMHEAGISDPKEQAAFIAQLAHESGGFVHMEELASGAAYEGRKSLGNTQPGDGKRFKGRGPIQLTGRANYRAAGKALGLDLEGNPQQASTPEVGFRVAAWYWKTRGCGDAARAGDFRAVTKKINGGYNGLASRQSYYGKALAAVT